MAPRHLTLCLFTLPYLTWKLFLSHHCTEYPSANKVGYQFNRNDLALEPSFSQLEDAGKNAHTYAQPSSYLKLPSRMSECSSYEYRVPSSEHHNNVSIYLLFGALRRSSRQNAYLGKWGRQEPERLDRLLSIRHEMQRNFPLECSSTGLEAPATSAELKKIVVAYLSCRRDYSSFLVHVFD